MENTAFFKEVTVCQGPASLFTFSALAPTKPQTSRHQVRTYESYRSENHARTSSYQVSNAAEDGDLVTLLRKIEYCLASRRTIGLFDTFHFPYIANAFLSSRNSQVSLGCSSLYVLTAWSCLVAATASCRFIEITGTNDGDIQTLTRGIWKGMSTVDSTCGSYSESLIDSKWKASMAMSVIACVAGGFAVIPLVCACGKKLLMSQVVSMSSSCMWACLFSGLTFLMLRSSACGEMGALTVTTCKLDKGGNLAIAATVLFFVASISMNCTFMAAVIAQEIEAEKSEAEKKEAEAKASDPEAGE
jgi:hypothetical protein